MKTCKFDIPMRVRLMDMVASLKLGTFLEKVVGRDLVKKIEFTKEEIKEAELNVNDSSWKWTKNLIKEFEFDEDESTYIVNRIKEADKNKTVDHFTMMIGEEFGYGKLDSVALHNDRDDPSPSEKA